MGEGFDLGSFLQTARSEGTSDSEGSFTIAQDKALDKLAHFSLPGEYDWVLKIVQAANRWDCPYLQVNQTRVATSFYFQPPEARFPTDADIVGSLASGSTEADGPVHELCIALRALVDQAKLSFVLATRHEGTLGDPIYSGDDVSKLGDQERRQWANLAKDGVRLTVSHFRGNESFTGRYIPTFSFVARRYTAIADSLKSRAFCSPVPILLDGREITNPLWHPRIGRQLCFRPLAIGVGDRLDSDCLNFQSYPAYATISRIQRPKGLASRETPWCLIRTFECLALKEHRGASRSLGAYRLQRTATFQDLDHRVFWVRHGVICRNQSIFKGSVGTTAFLFLPAGDLRSDLTGLSLRLDDRAEARANRFQRLVVDSLPQIAERLQLLSSKSGADSQIAFQSKSEIESIKRLEAGFSVFTAGLVGHRAPIANLGQQLQRTWRKLKALPFQEKLAREWRVFLEEELKLLQVDLANERRDSFQDF